MRIERDQLIAGIPAREVRRFMRRAAGHIIRIQVVTRILGLSAADATKFLKELEKEGWICANADYWQATEKGHALTMATAAKSLRRKTAERLIADVVERARKINRDSGFAYRVHSLAVFGSALTRVERPNDVDVACKLAARFTGEKQKTLEDERRANRGSFINTFEWAAWPKLEVLKTLKSKSRGYRFRSSVFRPWKTSITSSCFRRQRKPSLALTFCGTKAQRDSSGRMPASSTRRPPIKALF